jgi:CRISPR-associated protein Csa3
LHESDFDGGDTIVLVRPAAGDDDRSQEAIADIERTVASLAPGGVVEVEELPHDAFEPAVLACSDLFRAATGDLIVNFGGGARDVFLPFSIAALNHVDMIETAYYFSDVDGDVRSIRLPKIVSAIDKEGIDTLAAVASMDEPATISEIGDVIERSKSATSRRIDKLAEKQAVRREAQGTAKCVDLMLAGKLALRRSR